MYVSRVIVDNIKSFHGPRTVDLRLTRPDGSHAGWTVLAGRNGSGKTTLLRALALALSGPAAARGLVQGFENWMSRGEAVGTAHAKIVRDPVFDKFTASGRTTTNFWAGLRWTAPADGGGGRKSAQPALEGIRENPNAKSATPAQRGPWADNPVGWFCAAYGPFRRMAGVRARCSV